MLFRSFTDDFTFLALRGSRRAAADHLLEVLRGMQPGALQRPADAEEPPERGVAATLAYMTRTLLFDRQLPWKWRNFLWVWFIGRYLAARGLLRPFVK